MNVKNYRVFVLGLVIGNVMGFVVCLGVFTSVGMVLSLLSGNVVVR